MLTCETYRSQMNHLGGNNAEYYMMGYGATI